MNLKLKAKVLLGIMLLMSMPGLGRATATGRFIHNLPLTSINRFEPFMDLISAAGTGNRAVVNMLLANGADPNVVDDNGNTPLHFAALIGDAVITDALLNRGADPNRSNNNGCFPLHYAVDSGDRSTVEVLLRREAFQNVVDNDGCTPLHRAVMNNDQGMIDLLVRAGSDLDWVGPCNLTAREMRDCLRSEN